MQIIDTIECKQNFSQYLKLFSRNLGVLTEADQERLRNCRIGIAGVGGVGGNQLVTLARAGVGKFHIADPEVFNLSDRNRQYGAAESTMNSNKAVVMKTIINDINPDCEVKTFEKGINFEVIGEFVKDCDVIIDAIEYFTIEEKARLYQEARKHNIFVFTSPIIGFGSSLLIFDPQGMTFEEYFNLSSKSKDLGAKKLCPIYPEYLDKNLYVDAINKKRAIPSFAGSGVLSGALLATEVVLFLLGKRKPVTIPELTLVDFFRRSFDVINTADFKWSDFWSDFSKEAYDYIPLLPENQKMLNRVAELIGKGKEVLDAGCGTGNLTIKLAENNKVTAVDFSDGMLVKLKEKNKYFKNITIKVGDVTALDILNDTFDAVASVNVLFNLDDPEKAIREANRVLKKGGVFVVSSLLKNKGFAVEHKGKVIDEAVQNNIKVDKIEKIFDFQRKMYQAGGFKFTPTVEEICGLLTNNGFEVLAQEEAYYDTNFLISAQKIEYTH